MSTETQEPQLETKFSLQAIIDCLKEDGYIVSDDALVLVNLKPFLESKNLKIEDVAKDIKIEVQLKIKK